MQNTSAYPRTVADLVPGALALADQLGGEIPSRNRLMREFKIGAPKAEAIRAELARKSETDPGTPEHVQDVPAEPAAEPNEQATADGHPGTEAEPAAGRRAVVWPVVLLALPAFVAIWSGWVGLGGLTGFGVVHPLPGIADGFSINSAITLPIGVETYGAYALYVWLSGRVPDRARRFAKWSAIASLVVGALGQVAYHLLEAAGVTSAPWWITTAVACLPVAVLGMGAALAHLVREGADK
ncbi:ABC transporter permease [Micromonospora vinacea]